MKNDFNSRENKRDGKKTIFRIKMRVADEDDELMTLSQLENGLENTVKASSVIPYLVMVCKYKEPVMK